MCEQEEYTGYRRRARPSPLKDAQGNALSNQGAQVANPSDLESLHTAHVVDREGVGEIAAKGNRGVNTPKEELFSGVEPEGLVQLRAVV